MLVTDYDVEARAMKISIPPGIEPRRVSVDAIEHWMIYREHPDVGAILHVHAWVDGVDATQVNFPCGTAELAESVAELVREAPDPAHAIIGLKTMASRSRAPIWTRSSSASSRISSGTCRCPSAPGAAPPSRSQSIVILACAAGVQSGGAAVAQM